MCLDVSVCLSESLCFSLSFVIITLLHVECNRCLSAVHACPVWALCRPVILMAGSQNTHNAAIMSKMKLLKIMFLNKIFVMGNNMNKGCNSRHEQQGV